MQIENLKAQAYSRFENFKFYFSIFIFQFCYSKGIRSKPDGVMIKTMELD